MNEAKLNDLILQSLEHELGGVKIYEHALRCAVNPDLREEWGTYLEQTRSHVEAWRNGVQAGALDPDRETPSRKVVRSVGAALVHRVFLHEHHAA